jgi:hypothetical protein
MPELLAALDAFLREHRCCGDLDAGVYGERASMSCESGAQLVRPSSDDAVPRADSGG